MRVIVTGATGQLGYDVVRTGLEAGIDVQGLGSSDLDITDREAVMEYIEQKKPDAIIHSAAYTAVDKAEDERRACWEVNVRGTENLAEAAARVQAKFMYISTDYVFDGAGVTPFTERDKPNPSSIYGITKYIGEEAVKAYLDDWFIVRISWVFGENGGNFVKTMLKLAETRKELNVVGDQVGSPTYTADIAPLLLTMIQTSKYGVYHASNDGFCSWAEFAEEIFMQAKLNIIVNSITTSDYPTRAPRPKNSRMSKQKLDENGFGQLPTWQDAVNRYIKQLTVNGE